MKFISTVFTCSARYAEDWHPSGFITVVAPVYILSPAMCSPTPSACNWPLHWCVRPGCAVVGAVDDLGKLESSSWNEQNSLGSAQLPTTTARHHSILPVMSSISISQKVICLLASMFRFSSKFVAEPGPEFVCSSLPLPSDC